MYTCIWGCLVTQAVWQWGTAWYFVPLGAGSDVGRGTSVWWQWERTSSPSSFPARHSSLPLLPPRHVMLLYITINSRNEFLIALSSTLHIVFSLVMYVSLFYPIEPWRHCYCSKSFNLSCLKSDLSISEHSLSYTSASLAHLTAFLSTLKEIAIVWISFIKLFISSQFIFSPRILYLPLPVKPLVSGYWLSRHISWWTKRFLNFS